MSRLAQGGWRSPMTLGALLLEYFATAVHHVYGGVVFGTPERLHMAGVFTLVLLATLALRAVATSRAWARRALLAVIAVFWVVMLGGFEGGYNHVYHSVLFLLDRPVADYQRDLIFQASGVLTFAAAVLVAGVCLRPGSQGSAGDAEGQGVMGAVEPRAR